MQNEIFYYYLRDGKNNPYGCVAIQETTDGKINRGVSICSTKDHFNRAHARGLAYTRLKTACNSLFGKPFNEYHGNKPSIPKEFNGINMYDCNVKPTDFEARILMKPEDLKK